MTVDSASTAAGVPARGGSFTRLTLAASALFIEYLVIGLRHDGTVLAVLPDWRSHFASIGVAVQLAATIVTALLILDGPALAQRFVRMQAVASSIHRGWLIAHGVSFVLLAGLSTLVFSARPSAEEAILLTGVWLLSGCASLYTLLRALFGRGLFNDLSGVSRALWLAIPVAFVGWRLAVASWSHWSVLTRSTLLCSAALLRVFTERIRVDVASELLAVGDFEVLIRPACSGIEGMALLGVFSSAYVWKFRRKLRFPQALALIPLAVVAAWLTNIVRIAALMLIGAHGSAAVAAGGFHSKAGWLAFCALSLGVVLIGERVCVAPHAAAEAQRHPRNPTAVYCMPLVALLAVGMLTTSLSVTVDFAYAARILAAIVALWVYRRSYEPLLQKPSSMALLVGATVFAMWWLLSGPTNDQHNLEVAAVLRDLPGPVVTLWVLTRIMGSVLIVPVVEELAFRGYLLRRLVATDFEDVSPLRFSARAWVVSSLAFGCLHGQWVAGTLAGAAYAGAVFWRGRLSDAVVAHACTNALLSVFILTNGRWDLW